MKAGILIAKNCLKILYSRLHGDDRRVLCRAFWEVVKVDF
jgi:hypothetical protein